jgi:glycosyltransferase involved in cell wall biosynthesis
MKVLLLSLFHPELVRGGAQQVAYELFEGLRECQGIEAFLLCAIDPTFAAFYRSGARITGFDGRTNEFLFLSRDYDYTWHKCGEPLLLESYAEFLRVLKPDVVHFHHFLLFGIDLLTLTRRVLPSARIIFTFHEFLVICAAGGHMLRIHDKTLCSRASSVRCHQCFPQLGPDHFFAREMWMKKHLAAADAFTTPSRFMIERFSEWGVPAEKLHHVTNGQRRYGESRDATRDGRARNRFGFFGQLVDVKGVWLLLEAVQLLRSAGFGSFVIEINGGNLQYASPERAAELEAFRVAEAARPFAERMVFFNGPYEVDQLAQRMARVDWVVVPSVWWESFGLVISEAMMFRRPVIASAIGGPLERVKDEVDGLLFSAGDATALAAVLQRAATDAALWERLADNIAAPPSRMAMTEAFVDLYATGSE